MAMHTDETLALHMPVLGVGAMTEGSSGPNLGSS